MGLLGPVIGRMMAGMIRPGFLALLVLLPLLGCGTASPPDEQGGGAMLVETHPLSMRTPGWLEFLDLSLHPASQAAAPREPYVRGWIIGGLFVPEGEVVGVLSDAPTRRVLTRGWLDVRTRGFIPDTADRPRTPPWIDGWQDKDTGGFFPGSQVHDEAPAAPPSGS